MNITKQHASPFLKCKNKIIRCDLYHLLYVWLTYYDISMLFCLKTRTHKKNAPMWIIFAIRKIKKCRYNENTKNERILNPPLNSISLQLSL